MDKDSVTAVDEAGRVLCWMISVVGIGPTLKRLWDIKIQFEALPIPFASRFCDTALFFLNSLCPNALPPPVRELTTEYDHHLLITMGDFGHGEMERFRTRLGAFEAKHPIKVHACSTQETPWITYFRFAAAPAFRTWCIGRGLEGVSVDCTVHSMASITGPAGRASSLCLLVFPFPRLPLSLFPAPPGLRAYS